MGSNAGSEAALLVEGGAQGGVEAGEGGGAGGADLLEVAAQGGELLGTFGFDFDFQLDVGVRHKKCVVVSSQYLVLKTPGRNGGSAGRSAGWRPGSASKTGVLARSERGRG